MQFAGHQMPILDETTRSVHARLFSVLDARMGVKLDEESSYLTTFWHMDDIDI